MALAICYDEVTGEITKSLDARAESIELNKEVGELYVIVAELVDAETNYIANVETGEVVSKLNFALAPNSSSMTTEDEFVVTGIPLGTLVTYPGGTEVVNDEEIEWETAESGTYTFTFELFPYVTEVLTLEVT